MSHLNRAKVSYLEACNILSDFQAVCCFGHPQYGLFAFLKIEKKSKFYIYFSRHSLFTDTESKNKHWIHRSAEHHILLWKLHPSTDKMLFPTKCIIFHPSLSTNLITSIFQATHCILLQNTPLTKCIFRGVTNTEVFFCVLTPSRSSNIQIEPSLLF